MLYQLHNRSDPHRDRMVRKTEQIVGQNNDAAGRRERILASGQD